MGLNFYLCNHIVLPLNKILQYFNISKNKSFLDSGLKFFCILILGFVFFFNNVANAQEGIGTNQSPVFVVKGGAEIYSTDKDFNQQINNQKIILQDVNITFKKPNDGEVLLIASSKKIERESKDFKSQVAKENKKKDLEVLKQIKSKITDYESRKESFHLKNVKVFPSSEEFIASSHVNRDYVSPSQNQHDFSKIHSVQYQYVIKSALDFLHQQKYTFYNNKSLDFCFSQVFSVRPPPFLS